MDDGDIDIDMGSDVGSDVGSDMGMSELEKNAYTALFLIPGFLPMVIVVVLPFWERYKNKRRSVDEAERRLISTKLAKPIRQAYLVDLMKDYSMVLSKSDTEGNYDSKEEEGSCDGATIETCSELLTSSISSDTNEPKNDSKNEDSDDTLPDNDDIEMQRPKASSEEEEEENDANNHECDNSQCCHRTIYVPLPGQKVVECANDESENSASVAFDTKKQAHSDGCAVCLNPFEVGQRAIWSSNPVCPHVYHHECLLEWFDAVGTKAWEKTEKQRQARKEMDDRDVSTIEKEICDFPKLCPYCRRDYFLDGSQEET